MLDGGADIITFYAVGGKCISLGRRIVDDYLGTRDGERGSVEVEIAKETGVSRKFGLAPRGTEEIQGQVTLREQ